MRGDKFKPFQDIWILNKDGAIIFEHRSKYKIDTVYFKMLFDGLSEFVNNYFHEEMTNFKLGSCCYTFLKTDQFMFIGASKYRKNTSKLGKSLLKYWMPFKI